MRTAPVFIAILLVAAAVLAQSTTQPAEAPAAARVPHAAPVDGQVRQLTIKELGNFEYDEVNGGGIPEDVKRLSGSTIRLTGYMMPMDQADRITRFALVPSLLDCCYGQPPQLQHTITVSTPPGKAIQYYSEPIVCEGVLSVEEKKDGDWIISLFEMKVTSVKPAAN